MSPSKEAALAAAHDLEAVYLRSGLPIYQPERLEYIRLQRFEVNRSNLLVIQLSGGGAAIAIEDADRVDTILFKLRKLISDLETGAIKRVQSKDLTK